MGLCSVFHRIEDSWIDTNGLMGARWTFILKNDRDCDYEINNRTAVAVILKWMIASRLFPTSLLPNIENKDIIRTPFNFRNCFQEVSCSTNLYEEQHAPHHRRIHPVHLHVSFPHVRSWDPFHSRSANQYTVRSPFISYRVNSIIDTVNQIIRLYVQVNVVVYSFKSE